MCGKPNSADREVCQYCEARLKPLVAPPSSEDERHSPDPLSSSPEEPAGAEGEDLGEWLDSLRGGSLEEAEDAPGEAEDLSGEPKPRAAFAEEGDLPDWLNQLRDDIPEEEGTGLDEALTDDQDTGEDDLIRRLSSIGDLEEGPPEEVEESSPSPREAALDWSGEPAFLEGEAESAPDWLPGPLSEDVELESEGDPALPESEGAEEVPEEAFETREIPDLQADRSQVPDWLDELSDDEPRETAPSEESMDWASEAEEGEEAIPDWLQGAEPEEDLDWGTATQEIPGMSFSDQGGEEGEDEEELPEWLQRFEVGEPEDAEEVAGPTEAEGEGAIPDWLQDADLDEVMEGARETQEIPGLSFEGEDREEDEEIEEGELPVWLQSGEFDDILEEARETKDIPELSEESQPETEEPAWLADLTPQEPPTEGQEEGEAEADWQEAEPEGERPFALEAEDVPDWLRNLQSVQEEAAAEVEGETLAGLGEDLGEPGDQREATPAWMADIQARSAEASEEGEKPPASPPEPIPSSEGEEDEPDLAPAEIPDWLSEISEEARALEAGEVENVEGEIELSPAELPGWLKAMRPVEAVAPLTPQAERPDREVETAGPLAGLQGILPAEPEVTQAGRPPSFSVRVQVSDKQQSHINLLKELIGSEADAQPIDRRRVVQPQRILRWIIFIGLLLAVGFPLLTGSQSSSMPSLFPPETLAVGDTINGLQSEAPVLVAVDYQPGLSSELESAATSVVDHLMIRGARLTFLSTSPTGPALAERLTEASPALGEHDYLYGEDYVNLGYLAGGSVGLLNFAIDPVGTMPFAYSRQGIEEGVSVWTTPPLGNVRALGDFALVLVIVDDANTARAWIEQVQPRLGESTPLLMVVSAQAEPLVRPYYESIPRQVDGVVTGLLGGAAYEQIIGRDHQARQYWDAFSNGLLMAELLILLGGAYNLVNSVWRLRGQPRVEGGP
jgi:hypothetical protein